MRNAQALEVYDWVTENGDIDTCTLTAPTTLSDEIIEYLSELLQWSYDKEAEAQEILDECDFDRRGGGVDSCGNTGKIVFTASNSTKTVAFSSAIPTPTATSTRGSGNGNAAAPRGAAMGAVVAAALGAVGVVMAL
ncbi:hypothetical protein NM208_g12496 [Fusarium decemcellulare]|uniref:Uncharacterized protein n=1 Tax=Fusarium decemcellulare TaxID=57161 RepID=A0ACC1RNS3_9HYPO|nr:hypothetical protein NM208_g12496 [Fusarium decemcellulare]